MESFWPSDKLLVGAAIVIKSDLLFLYQIFAANNFAPALISHSITPGADFMEFLMDRLSYYKKHYHLKITHAIASPPPLAQNKTTSPGWGPIPFINASSKAIGIQAAPV